MAQFGTPGVQSVSNQTDIAIGPSGAIIRVFSIHMISDSTASTVTLRNGTSSSGTPYIQVDGTISKGVTLDFANGVLFPGGCFADVDSHTAYLTVVYSVEL